MTITFADTGAQLTLDISDTQVACRGDAPEMNPGETLPWEMPPLAFEEGTYKITQMLEGLLLSRYYLTVNLTVEKNDDGVLTGRLEAGYSAYNLADVYFDEEGWVAGYKFTSDLNGEDVGIEHAGSFVKDMHFVSGGTDRGTFNIDLSSVRVIDKTKPPKEEVIPEEVHEEIPAEPLEEEVSKEIKVEFVPLSPASLSIDENGVLKRLKDNGDWEPVYLLACGQFAAMNSAEERNGVYYATPASGALTTGVSGKDGMGTITSGTLERSTVDLAHELSEMIRAQHAYAANTKVFSTIEDMLEELERL
jgi:hypothetical protein